MSGKIRVLTNLQELCAAFEDSSIDHRYYYDLETGGIILDFLDITEREKLNKIAGEDTLERCRYLPIAESHEEYEDMKEFIETVKGTHLKEKLYIAISGRGAFRRFKDVLNSYPKERERWFKFKDERVTERVNKWLEDEGIEIIPKKPIEIKEISSREIFESSEIEEAWKGFGARGCLDCDNEDEFKERYFIISRCPDSEEEQDWLDETLKKRYGIKNYGIGAGVFNDSRGLVTSTVCRKCGSHDIFFDF
jgi:hypothetical protein